MLSIVDFASLLLAMIGLQSPTSLDLAPAICRPKGAQVSHQTLGRSNVSHVGQRGRLELGQGYLERQGRWRELWKSGHTQRTSRYAVQQARAQTRRLDMPHLWRPPVAWQKRHKMSCRSPLSLGVLFFSGHVEVKHWFGGKIAQQTPKVSQMRTGPRPVFFSIV